MFSCSELLTYSMLNIACLLLVVYLALLSRVYQPGGRANFMFIICCTFRNEICYCVNT